MRKTFYERHLASYSNDKNLVAWEIEKDYHTGVRDAEKLLDKLELEVSRESFLIAAKHVLR